VKAKTAETPTPGPPVPEIPDPRPGPEPQPGPPVPPPEHAALLDTAEVCGREFRSFGHLAVQRDRRSVLGEISASRPNE
jgi:hypothetical protein